MKTTDTQQDETQIQESQKVFLYNILDSYTYLNSDGETLQEFYPFISVEIEDPNRIYGTRNVAYIDPTRTLSTPSVPLTEANRAIVDQMVESGNVIILNIDCESSLLLQPLNWDSMKPSIRTWGAYHPDQIQLQFPITVEEKNGHMVGTDAQGYQIAKDQGLAKCIFSYLNENLSNLQNNPDIRITDERFMQELNQLVEEKARKLQAEFEIWNQLAEEKAKASKHRQPPLSNLRNAGPENRTEPENLTSEKRADLQELQAEFNQKPEYNDRMRVSEVSVMMMGLRGPHIRCKIDGVQQSATPISVKDYVSFKAQRAEKTDLALKYFSNELDWSVGQEQNQGMKR